MAQWLICLPAGRDQEFNTTHAPSMIQTALSCVISSTIRDFELQHKYVQQQVCTNKYAQTSLTPLLHEQNQVYRHIFDSIGKGRGEKNAKECFYWT